MASLGLQRPRECEYERGEDADPKREVGAGERCGRAVRRGQRTDGDLHGVDENSRRRGRPNAFGLVATPRQDGDDDDECAGDDGGCAVAPDDDQRQRVQREPATVAGRPRAAGLGRANERRRGADDEQRVDAHRGRGEQRGESVWWVLSHERPSRRLVTTGCT